MSNRISRRQFLLGLGALGAASTGLGSLVAFPRRARADGLPQSFTRKLVNVVLDGGPDFRHLLVPRPATGDTTAYGYFYWKYRAKAHAISGDDPSTWENRYANDYDEITRINGVDVTPFGVLKKAGWLKDQLVAGNVAVVANVKHSENRDHPHSLLVLQSGDLRTSSYATDRDGWGGRLADAVGGNVFSLTRQRRLFANLPRGSSSQVVSARDSRKFGLVHAPADEWVTSSRAVSDRALTSYYAGKRNQVDMGSPHAVFLQHEQQLRDFSDAVQSRLGGFPVPDAMAALYAQEAPGLPKNRNFGEQVRGVLDCLACEDILGAGGVPFGFRVASLDYSGWDSHKNQKEMIEPSLEEIFGTGKALDVLHQQVAAAMPGAWPQLVFTVAGEFGRQLRANGDGGTDHGRGNSVLVFGAGVRGGLYGDLFPMSEITELVDGKNRYEAFNRDIDGKTAFDRVFGAVTDWVGGDDVTGDAVFPGRSTSALEAGVTLTRASLFKQP